MRKPAVSLLVVLGLPLAGCQSITTGHGVVAADVATSAGPTSVASQLPSGSPTASEPTESHSLGNVSPTSTPSSTPSATPSPSPKPSQATPKPKKRAPSGPAAVVTKYVGAINKRDYPTAWALYHLAAKGQSYNAFVAGFGDTDHDQLKITGTSGSTVHVDLVGYQTDGSTRHYTGTYTVQNNRITAAHLSAAP